MLLETAARRDEAERLLGVLIKARESSESNLKALGQSDLVKQITGKSSLDTAINSTKRLIESFNRVLKDLRSELGSDELALLNEIEREAAAKTATSKLSV